MTNIDLNLLSDYLVEAAEHLEEMESLLLRLAQEPESTALLDEIFRPIHSIKGAAQFIGLERSSHLAHRLEDLLDLLRKGERQSSPEVVELLISARDMIVRLADELDNTHTEASSVDDMVEQITAEIDGTAVSESTDTSGDLAEDEAEQSEATAATGYKEENDKELFGIFLENLREKIDLLRTQSAELVNSPDKVALLERCAESIKGLQSAANYMGYEELTHIYSNWLEDIVSVQEALGRNEDIPYDFMDGYLSEIASQFPQLGHHAVAVNKDVRPADVKDESSDEAVTDESTGVNANLLSDYLMEAAEHLEQAEIEGTAKPEATAEGTEESGEVAEQSEAPATTGYEEENDQELFGIFLENLREKIDLLRTQATELVNSPDKVALLERCAESIKGLQSAANYMGYEELTHIYSNWLEDIVSVQEALGRNEDVPYDFMDGYLSEIASQFPQLGQMETTVEAKQTSTDQSVKAEVNQHTNGTDTAKTEEENLYDKLSNALNTAASDSEGAEYELLHGVFEEMISERDGAPAEKQSAVVANSKKQKISSKPADKAPAAKTKDSQAGSTETKAAAGKKAGTDKTAKAGKKPQQTDTGKEGQQVKRKSDQQSADRRSDEPVVKKNVRVDAEKIDTLINQVGELVVDRAYFFQLFEDMRSLQQHFKDEIGLDQKEMKQVRAFTYRMGEAIASLSRTSNELQEGVMKVRMLPISALFNRYPRLVHDLTRNNTKKVDLKVEGEDTELDKMVVEKLSDPLIHIIRNAVDHGLEDANERVSAGKPETGTLFLKSYHESNQVVVEIMDDGRGIDPNLIKDKAIEKGIVSKNEADRMTPQELIRLITAAGFSTAKEITDTSGRGVGMDVVRKNIEKLNGTLEIDSRPGKGTSIRLKIPLTLAIIPAHLVRVEGNMYTIPLANIEETLKISRNETTIIEGTEVVYLRGKTLPVIHLSNIFNVGSDTSEKQDFFVVVVNTGTQKIGLVVDELLGQEEVVIKPLVDYLRDKSGFSGATIIGDGSISLILDIYEIANMTVNQQIRRQNELVMARNSGDADSHAGRAAG